MTFYEFYITYIVTGKALIVSTNLQPLRTILTATTIRIEYRTSANRGPFEIPHDIPRDIPINHLIRYGIKITLVTDPVYISASTLTGVISIPVPEPDELPF